MADPAADQDAQQIQEADAGQHSEPPELPARHCTLCALQSKPAAVADDQFVGLCTSLGDCRPCHGHLSCIYMFHSNVLTPKWSSHRFKLLDETCVSCGHGEPADGAGLWVCRHPECRGACAIAVKQERCGLAVFCQSCMKRLLKPHHTEGEGNHQPSMLCVSDMSVQDLDLLCHAQSQFKQVYTRAPDNGLSPSVLRPSNLSLYSSSSSSSASSSSSSSSLSSAASSPHPFVSAAHASSLRSGHLSPSLSSGSGQTHNNRFTGDLHGNISPGSAHTKENPSSHKVSSSSRSNERLSPSRHSPRRHSSSHSPSRPSRSRSRSRYHHSDREKHRFSSTSSRALYDPHLAETDRERQSPSSSSGRHSYFPHRHSRSTSRSRCPSSPRVFVETDWDQAGTGKRKTSLPASSKAIKDPSRNVGPKSVTVDVYVCVVAQDEVVHLQGKHLSPVRLDVPVNATVLGVMQRFVHLEHMQSFFNHEDYTRAGFFTNSFFYSIRPALDVGRPYSVKVMQAGAGAKHPTLYHVDTSIKVSDVKGARKIALTIYGQSARVYKGKPVNKTMKQIEEEEREEQEEDEIPNNTDTRDSEKGGGRNSANSQGNRDSTKPVAML